MFLRREASELTRVGKCDRYLFLKLQQDSAIVITEGSYCRRANEVNR